MNNHITIGKLGEDIACIFLEKRGFEIIKRNYRRRWGEIDIICRKKKVLNFVEVKTVTREIGKNYVIHETAGAYQPEDAIHPWKIKRLMRIIQSYLLEAGQKEKTEWQFDTLAVFLDSQSKIARTRFTENIQL